MPPVRRVAVACLALSSLALAQTAAKPHPWEVRSLSPDRRADLVLQVLTLDQKIQLLHGTGDPHDGPPDPHSADGNAGSGYVPGFPDLGIPGIQMDDSAVGVAYSAGSGRYATLLPSSLGMASSWNPAAEVEYGRIIGQELRDQGFNMSLGGGVNLTREPRNGRTFEYAGEDPLLAGTMVGHLIQGVQSTHVLGDIKHFAVNDQESGRHAVSSVISERAMRETDLLAFQIGIALGHPAAVMCAYNRVNGTYACENDFLLRTVLKGDWAFPGFVVSDWLATHSTLASSHAGLDNEEPTNVFYGAPFKQAVEAGKISTAELDDHVHRILRSMFAAGIVDDPPHKQVTDALAHARTARELEQQSIVLLRNQGDTLPLDPTRIRSIAVIGRAADKGTISGGGSAQVDPPGGNAIGMESSASPQNDRAADWQKAVWFPGSPLEAIRDAAPGATVTFHDGADPASAAAAARSADLALVFAYQWQAEGVDLPSLALPDNQNALLNAITAANPHTVVVLETGGPVLMPWASHTAAILEAWYPGIEGAQAIADVLFGRVSPSAKLPVTFPLADSDLPHPTTPQPPPASQEDWSNEDRMSRKLLAGLPSFDTVYDEGLKVGYKWYESAHKPVLFPFGFGLTYTTFSYSNLRVTPGAQALTAELDLLNTGSRPGTEIVELYAALPASAGEPPQRLVAWQRVPLAPGAQQHLTLTIPRERLHIWHESHHRWQIVPGDYTLRAGSSSQDLPLHTTLTLR